MGKYFEDAQNSLERLIEELIRASAADGWDGGDGLAEAGARAERAGFAGPEMAGAGKAAAGLAGAGVWGVAGTVLAGIGSLFDSGAEAPAPPPVSLWRPVKKAWTAGVDLRTGEGPFLTDRDASGRPRPMPAAAPGAPAQITLNVQALDARSIIERSAEIADAVRAALLSAHPLADVIAEI